MESIKTGDKSCIAKTITVLSGGGVVLFPTDTQYGLGADALSDDAVAKIYEIKGRDEKKPIHCIVSDMAMAEKYAKVTDMARKLADEFLPGPLTLILKKQKGIQTGIARGIDTIGIRIPDHPFCRALVKKLGRPITATSANKSGRKPECDLKAILKQLGVNIDLVIDAGELPERLPSTAVDVSGKRPIIVREGAIPAADIWSVLREEP